MQDDTQKIHPEFNVKGHGSDLPARDITVRPITPDDWASYRDYYKGLKNPHHFSGFLEGKDLDDKKTYDALFSNTIATDSFVMFGMWHDDKMIGQSSINFFETSNGAMALLAGSEIAEDYRGQRLINNFYQARMNYLRDTGFEGEVRTTIRPDNFSSKKAAQRNGFIDTGKLDEHGYCIFVPDDPAPADNHRIATKPSLPNL